MRKIFGLLLLTAGAALAFPNPDGGCSITTASTLPTVTAGTLVDVAIATSGCSTPLRYVTHVTGTMPGELNFVQTATGGQLIGTPKTAGVYAFTLRVVDGNFKLPSKSFVLTVNAKPTIITPALASGTSGQAYSDTVKVKGGIAPYTFSVVEGSLPSGLTIAPSTGVVSGTMPATGSQFRIRATDSSSPAQTAERPFTIAPGGQVTTLATPPVGSTGTPYSFDVDGTLGATGFVLQIGPLPTGLSIDTNGTISGTPTVAGEYNFTVRQTSGTTSVWRSYQIRVNGPGGISGTPRNAEETFAYEHVFTASGGIAPYTYSISAGSLPAGITLDASTGALLGELPLAGVGTAFTVAALDSTGRTYTQAFSITKVTKLTGSTSTPPTAVVDTGQSAPVYALASGGADKTFFVEGGTGQGHVSVDYATGEASYNFPGPGTFTPVVVGYDELGGAVAFTSPSYTAVRPIAITPGTELPNGRAGVSYSATVGVSNGIFTPLTFSVSSGALPTGLSLNTATGAITGIPDAMLAETTYNFTIGVIDQKGNTSSRVYFMGIGGTVAITSTSVPAATTNVSYSTQLTGTGTASPAWTLFSGSLPTGLLLSGGGLISGTPTVAGSYTFQVKMTPSAAVTTSDIKEFTIHVANPMIISFDKPSPWEVQTGDIDQSPISVSGGRGQKTLSLASGTLPNGMFLYSGTSLHIGGAAGVDGTYVISITVTDADGRTATAPYTIHALAGPRVTKYTLPTTSTNQFFSDTLTATGGTGPYTWSFDEGGPFGVSITSGGVISGTFIYPGLYEFPVVVTDSVGRSSYGYFSMNVTDPLAITNGFPLASAVLFANYNVPITTTGGATKTFSISSGNLPPLITIDPVTGVVGNVALFGGVYNFTVKVEDTDGRVATKAEQITITGGIVITPAALPNATKNSAYSQALTATGAVSAVTWSVSAGALPAGITLNPSSGLLSGTPTVAGSFNFTVQAVDSAAVPATRNYTLLVLDVLTISPATLPNATKNSAYSQALGASPASGSVTWSVTAGTLPAGITLNPGTGVLSGTPTAAGTANFTVTAVDALTQTGSRAYSLLVLDVLTITPLTLPNGTINTAYSQALAASPASGAVNWEVTAGTMPLGLSLNPTTGLVSGTPTTAGTFNFTVTAIDSISQTGSRAYTVQILNVLNITPATLPSATVNTPYSQTLTATGGTGAVTWAVTSGALPAGISLAPSTGVLSGTPTVTGSFDFAVTATDSLSQTGQKGYTLQVQNTLSISPATLPAGTVDIAYGQTLTANGASGAVTWAVTAGALPAGLTLGPSTGVISGTPTAAGSSSFTVTATDSISQTGQQAYTMQVNGVLTISPNTLPNGTNGTAYSQALTVGGATGAVTWAVTAGALPAGLTLGPSTGVISGTPTASGLASFSVTATDSLSQSGVRAYTLQINGNLSITPSAVPSGTVGTSYSQALTVNGATGAVTWTVSVGALPAGLTLGSSTGIISGTPTAGGSFSFTAQATDSLSQSVQQAYTMQVANLLTISPASLPNAATGQAYSRALTASPATGAVTWAVTGGALPSGMTLGSSTGIISGTSNTGGSFNFTVTATDSIGQSGQRAYTLGVIGGISITPATISEGAVNSAYSQALTANSAVGAVSWTILNGSLPPGVSLGSSTGIISGTPTAAGEFPFTVSATDSAAQAAVQAYSIRVGSSLSIAPATLPSGVQGTAYNQTVTATGQTGAVTWSVTGGALPTGLTLAPQTGAISGTPTVGGSFTFTLNAVDSVGVTGHRTYTVQVSSGLAISPATLPDGAVNVSYSQTLAVASPTAGATWSVTGGALPPGLTLGPSTGTISGTPTASGLFGFTVLVQVGGQTGVRDYTILVTGGVSITPLTLPSGTVGSTYGQTLTATGAVGSSTWSVSGGGLPPGLTLGAATGLLGGTPTTAGTYTFTVLATDIQSQTGARTYTLLIGNFLNITPATLPDGDIGLSYSQALAVTGAGGPVTWSVTAGALPTGLTLNPSTGLISGTPSVGGPFRFTVRAADTVSGAGQRAYMLHIAGGITITPTTAPGAVSGTAYSLPLTANGATGAVAWTLPTGTLPAGLTLNPSTGLISGTPTAPGTFTFTVRAFDSVGQSGRATYTVTVSGGITIDPATLPDGGISAPYSQTLTATSAQGSVAWSISGGTLPPGLTLGPSTGIISGTPTSGGTFSFTVQAMDSTGRNGQRSYTVSILVASTIISGVLPDGAEQEPYSAALQATGGSGGGFTWSILNGALPPGIGIGPSTGILSGTPTTHGTYAFTVEATDSRGQKTSKAFSILIYEALRITTATLGGIGQGQAYASTLNAVGGKSPYTWGLSGTSLPAGITLAPSTGVVSGSTNAAPGQYPQDVTVTDGRGKTVTKRLALEVTAPPVPSLSLFPLVLPNGRVGDPYVGAVSASGGVPGYIFQVAQGSLPPGLAFTNGALRGTPTVEGTFRFTINVTDSDGRVAGNLYTVVIDPALLPLAVTPASIPATAQLGQPFSVQFGATGGKGPYTFSVTGTTPPGTVFDTSALLNGTPNAGGTYQFIVSVTDSLGATASRSYTIAITGTLTITTQPPLPDGTTGRAYSITFGATGGRTPYTWSITGSTPPGLSLDSATGTLSGTPTATGTFPFRVQVQDAQQLTASAAFSITVYEPLQITNSPAATPLLPGEPYSFQYTTRGGKPPISFRLTNGNLPAGLQLASDGTISGTPTTPGTNTFTVQATDSLGNTATQVSTLRVIPPLNVVTASLPTGTVGVEYSAKLEASGGLPPLGNWSIPVGSLPDGLTLAPDGTISGTPAAAGTSTFTVRITDSAGSAATKILSIVVALPPVPPIVVTGLPQTLPPGTQVNITITLARPFPATVTGMLTLIFEPNAVNNADDPAVQFSSGGRTVTFTIPAGQTSGVFPVTPLRINSGTVAGTIRIRVTTSPESATPVPDAVVPVVRSPPVITAGTAQLGTNSFTLLIDGYSNTREITSATFRLTPTAGAPLATTDVPVPVASAFTTWYQSSTSQPFGGQFRLTMPFNVSGLLADIESVTVTVTNSVGTSQPFTVRLR